jgi:Tfp pilus assembly protein FimV
MPRPAGQGFVTPQQQMILRTNLFQTPNTESQSAQGTLTTPNATLNKANTTCFNCGQKGHYANRCPSRCKSSTPTPATPAQPSHNGDSTPIQAQQNYAQGRVNQVTMEETQNAPTVVPGTSLINSILS